MKQGLYFLYIILLLTTLIPLGLIHTLSSGEPMQTSQPPQYLYKILSVENWKKSQSLQFVVLSEDDQEFIHLATEEQLQRIANKYWSHVPEYIVLKIDTTRLEGQLIFESNEPGGNQYYHLYDGGIPLESILKANIVK